MYEKDKILIYKAQKGDKKAPTGGEKNVGMG